MTVSWQALALTPLDTLFFREPRPFTAGEGSDAWSVFPPTPLTIQGMIRSRLLSSCCGRWTEDWAKSYPAVEKVVGPPGGLPGTLTLQGPWLLREGTWLLPAPLDLVVAPLSGTDDTANSPRDAAAFRPVKAGARTTSLPKAFRPLQPPDKWTEFSGANGWLSWEAYQTYLLDGRVKLTPKKNWWQPDMLWDEELRPGIAMDNARNRAQEGMLYFARHTRLSSGVKIGLQVAGLDGLPQPLALPSLAPLGGEGKAVSLDACGPPPWGDAPRGLVDKIASSGQFKIILTQPAWFAAAWHPDWMNEQTGACVYSGGQSGRGLSFTWVAARIERPLKIGGWDLAKRRPKPLRAFVPAGSVFYFKDQKDASAVCEHFWARCLSQNPKDEHGMPVEAFEQIGFGHALVGTWKEADDV